VGRKNQADLVVADIDVGMMFLILGHFGDGVDEIDRLGEVIELERALDVFLLELPFRHLLEAVFQVVGFDQLSHNGGTFNTPKTFCNGHPQVFLHQP
jgi:hypothetical protein